MLFPKLLPHLARFRLRAHRWTNGMVSVDLSSRRRSAACPSCQHRSRAVHSVYRRTVADLPLAGAKLVLHLHVRRFFCRNTTCPQRIFAERFPSLVPVRGRHSLGVCAALRQVGMAVGGRPGMRLTRALGIPGSYRTIVRLVHGAPFPLLKVPRVIGLDEWAWRRGRRFGTIVCDLERHHVLDLLPERTASSIGSTWCGICAMPWSGAFSAIGGASTPWRVQGIDPQRSCPCWRRSAKRATPAGSTATTRSNGCTPNTWGLPPSRGRSRSVARRSIGISPCPSRPRGNGHGIADRS